MLDRHDSAAEWTFWRRSALFTCYTLLLFASYFFNVFNVLHPVRPSHIGFDSYLVLNRFHLAEQGGDAFLPMVRSPLPGHPYGIENPHSYFYMSQLGLQAIGLSAVLGSSGLDPINFAYLVAALFCLATSSVLAAFFVSIARRFGAVTAHLAAFGTALSPILAEFSTSIYWSAFLLFAPFVCTWILYPAWSTTRNGRLALAGLVFVLVALKASCGYEYLTAIALSPLVAVLFHHLLAGDLNRQQLWTCGSLFAASCLAFVMVFALHAWQLGHVLNMSGFDVIMERATARTYRGNPLHEVPMDFQGRFSFLPAALEYPVNCFWHYFTLPAFGLPLGYQVGFWMPTLFCLSLLGYAVWQRRQVSRELWAIAVGCGLAFAASMSWQTLVVNHMCVHFHLNQSVFWLPFMLLAVVAMGWCAQQAALFWNISRQVELLLAPACLLLVVASVQWHLLQQTARQTREFRTRVRMATALEQPNGTLSPEVVGAIDHVVEQTRAGNWTHEMARSNLITMSGEKERELVIYGWAADVSSANAPKKIVVMQGDKVLAEHQTTFMDRPDVEAYLKTPAPKAGFTTTVILPPDKPNEPIRLFVLTGPNYTKTAELWHASLANRGGQTMLR